MEKLQYSLFSVMGPHAGEGSAEIFDRKIADVLTTGRTFWVIRSHKAKPDMVQTIGATVCATSGNPLCAFLAPSSPGGAAPTKTASAATAYSADHCVWNPLPSGIGPVTGQLTPGTCALVFDDISLQPSTAVDLWQYADFFAPGRPVTIRQGASTLGVTPHDTSSHPDRIKTHLRAVLAIGRLAHPFAVWLK
jgi:hypothetical protein